MHLIHNRKELMLGVGGLVGVLALNAGIGYYQGRKLYESSAWVAHTHEVLSKVQRTTASIANAESLYRGYLLTDDRTFLEPFETAVAESRNSLDALAALTSENRHDQALIPQIKDLLAERLAHMQRGVELRENAGFAAASEHVASNRVRELTEAIRGLADEIQSHERNLLHERDRENKETYRSLILSNLAAGLIGLIAVGAFLWLLDRYLTAITRATALLHEQRELLHAMLLSIGDGVIATDQQGRVSLLNDVAQKLTGWTHDDARGRDLPDVFRIVNELTRRPVENPALRALREGRIVGLANHTVLVSRNGEEWPIDDSAAVVRNERGEVSGAILVFREIRERKRQEAQLVQHAEALQEADRRKDEFLATLAHELRNPLAPLSNALQVWPLVENDREQMEQLRQMMERQVHQMRRLIDDLLDVSRITRGKIELRRQEVDVGTLISGAIEAVEPFITACGHTLHVTLSEKPLHVNGDVARLTQVFANILHNAAKYTGRNGEIRISVGEADGSAIVKIGDNGPGIPPEKLGQIFEMFQQVDQTLERSHGGLGIGLTLVKRLVELHGGHVEAHSEGAGKGSEFVVTLPVLASGDARGDDRAAERNGARVGRLPCLRILVVDDVQASAKTLTMMLRSIGQNVEMLHDGQAAIDWVESHRPDLVILDIAMPGMNGYDVAREIRRRPELAETFLVALTGYGQEEDRRRAIEAGFNYHLTKPTSLDALEQLLLVRPDARRPAPLRNSV